MNLPDKDSATSRGLRTGIFSALGALFVFGTGLIAVLNGVPGCTSALVGYLRDNSLQLALTVGVPSGIISFIFNALRPSVKNY